MKPLLLAALLSPLLSVLSAQPGSPSEPLRLLSAGIDLQVHDGRLRPAIGVENIQVMRANRTHPDLADGLGWTYSHAPCLAYWNGRFFLQYLSNPFGEHHAPGQTLVVTSRDGRNWDKPQPVFPIYYLRPGPISGHESGMAMMHQRMGFYVAPNGRLLVLGHYGLAPDPMGDKGIGRVVREALADGTYGPIYFIRYNSLAGANEKNTTRFPFYLRAPDEGFVAACEALLADKLKTMQWREEDRSEDGFYTAPGPSSKALSASHPILQAPAVYHRKDGKAVVLWKSSWAALSADEGKTWSTPVELPTVVTGTAKTWAQRTDDGRYAMVYNPAKTVRWPLAVATSDDGVIFDNLLLVNGEVPPRRFFGRAKDFGLQYTRGISEGNGNPPGSDLWVTYSNNKEDLWISRIPVPVRSAVVGPVADSFDKLDAGGTIPEWNVYRPRWANVSIAEFPSAANKSLLLEDREPYDHAKAVRVFAEAKSVRIAFRIFARQVDTGRMEIEVLDGAGRRPVRIALGEDGRVRASDGAGQVDAGPFLAGRWYQAELSINAATGRYDLAWDGRVVVREAAFAEAVTTVERLSFCTGAFRTEPTRQTNRYGVLADVANPDTAVAPAAYYLDDVAIK
jgi:hypothetical protein